MVKNIMATSTLGTTAFIHGEETAVLPTTAFAPSMQMSTK